MNKKYANYRNPVIHNFSGTVTCVKGGKDFNVSAGMRLNGLTSIKIGSGAQVSILLDETAKKGKLCGIIVKNEAEISVTVEKTGITVELIKGTCMEVNAEQDNVIPSGLGNTSMGVRG